MLASAFAPVLLAVVPCIAPCLPEPVLAAPAEPRTAVLLAGGGSAASPGEAAELARQQTGGGQVLSVRRTGAGYEVRVLTPRGEVRIVQVPASGG